MVINADVAVFVDDDQRIGVGRFVQPTVQQRGLAAAQKSRNHCHADALVLVHVPSPNARYPGICGRSHTGNGSVIAASSLAGRVISSCFIKQACRRARSAASSMPMPINTSSWHRSP
ncbi:hypothetical protein G6F46_015219 [Rhizopus delemar]|nr:hypothetical protein G6F46_015219 [Rhizopus delemar]